MKKAIEEIGKIVGLSNLLLDEPMRKHTSFRTGGPADLFIMPKTVEELNACIVSLREHQIPYWIVGNGSNLLIRDKGIRGAVIQLHQNMSKIEISKNQLYVQAGALLSTVAASAMEAGLGGFAFAAGIPGSIGGAVTMNAGAYGSEMKNVLVSVEVLTPEMEIKTLSSEELDLSYRHSVIPEKSYIVLSAVLKLQPQPKEEIKAEMKELAQKRREKQPLQYPSAGSTFKRPEGYFAGKLIQDSGLKGKQIGGAQVSELHAGFVINKDNATSQDILDLVAFCKEEVYRNFGVRMEEEIKVIGEI